MIPSLCDTMVRAQTPAAIRNTIVTMASRRQSLDDPAREELRVTYSLLAVDSAAGLIGVATASRSLAVGNAVPAIDPAVGAVASQAWTNRRLRAQALDALAAGLSPAEVVAQVPTWDDGAPLRQLAVLDIRGRGAHVTGARCTGWAGGRDFPGTVAIGNLLADGGVLDAMCESFTESSARPPARGRHALETFAARLLAALVAGERAGGDARGRESAAVQVARVAEHRQWPPELAVDLRSDHDPEPLERLAELLALRFAGGVESAATDVAAATPVPSWRQTSSGVTAPRTTVTPSDALAHQCGVEQP